MLPQWGQNIVRGLFSLLDHAGTDHTGIPGVGGSGAPAAHAASHADGGSDEVNATGLTGVPVDLGWLEVSVNLTDAEIKTLFSVGKQILPAPGPNKIYQILKGFIALDNAAGLYVGVGNLILQQATGSGLTTSTVASAAFFTADAASSKASYSGSPVLTGLAAHVNNPINIVVSTADFTGGNAANKATVKVIYRILSTLPA